MKGFVIVRTSDGVVLEEIAPTDSDAEPYRLAALPDGRVLVFAGHRVLLPALNSVINPAMTRMHANATAQLRVIRWLR